MDFKIEAVSGIGEYTSEDLMNKERKEGKIFLAPNGKAFVVFTKEKRLKFERTGIFQKCFVRNMKA